MGSTIKASKEEVLLGVRIESDLTFKENVMSILSKANQKLHALIRVSRHMSLEKFCILMKLFITSQINYCPIVSMCHSRSLNNKVNHIHERALCIVYQDFQSRFSVLLIKDNLFTMHKKNLQLLAIEIFKVKMNISPKIMNKIFDFSKNSAYELRCGNCLSRSHIHSTHFWIESIANIEYGKKYPKKGIKYLTKSKKHAPLQFLKVKFKNGFQRVALVDFAKHMA